MKFTEKQILAAIKGTAGIYSSIISNLESLSKPTKDGVVKTIRRNSLRERVERSPTLTQAYEEERDKIDDIGESQFVKALQDDDNYLATRDWLKYRGSRRSYQEKTQQEVTVDLPKILGGISAANDLPKQDSKPKQKD